MQSQDTTKRKNIVNMNFVRTFWLDTWFFQQLPCDSLFTQAFMEKKVTFVSLPLSLEMKVKFKNAILGPNQKL